MSLRKFLPLGLEVRFYGSDEDKAIYSEWNNLDRQLSRIDFRCDKKVWSNFEDLKKDFVEDVAYYEGFLKNYLLSESKNFPERERWAHGYHLH